MLSQYILKISEHIFTLLLTFIIKLAGAVDSTTLPTTPEKSAVNVQYWFSYADVFICFHIFSTNLFKCLIYSKV